jgi:hypothetical protein
LLVSAHDSVAAAEQQQQCLVQMLPSKYCDLIAAAVNQ